MENRVKLISRILVSLTHRKYPRDDVKYERNPMSVLSFGGKTDWSMFTNIFVVNGNVIANLLIAYHRSPMMLSDIICEGTSHCLIIYLSNGRIE